MNKQSFWRILLRHARAEAHDLQHKYIRSEHLLLALLRMPDCEARKLFDALNISYDDLVEQANQLARPLCAADERLTLSANAERIVTATQNQHGEVSRDLLHELVKQSPLVRKMLLGVGVPDEWIARICLGEGYQLIWQNL